MIRTALFLVPVLALAACTAEAPKSGAPGGNAPAGNAAPAWKKIAPSANYPLKTCVVSGDAVDSMGGIVAIEYQGREVQFCCDHCTGEFEKDPAKFLAMIDAAKK